MSNKHSIKVPRLYKVSAQVAKEVSEGIGSIKSLVYEKQKKHPNIKAIYALVATLFQKTDELETLLKRSQLLVKEPKFESWLAKVLIVELLWGKKKLPGQSRPENTIRAYEQIFKAHLSDDISKETIFKENDIKPRYVRVNTLLSSLNEAVDAFREDGWTLIKFSDKTDYKGYLEKIVSLNNDEFIIDIHVPNLLVFPSKTTFYNHPAYKNGSILLQDKASCLPVHILGPPPGSTVLDMCAAPGMKTTHLAAVLNDQGTVYAIERNPKRFETLSRIVETSGAKCVKIINKDVLNCTKEEFSAVEYILVDPSCSGTGMTDRPQENQLTQSRLVNLTGFQIKILRHALTKFPDVKRVVYSTCSILPEENEDVVRQVLETNYNFKLVPAKQFVGDSWQSFGSPDFGDIGKFCLYAKPKEDFTNGFFLAVFERLQEGEENQFFNSRIFNFKKHIQASEKWKEKKQKKIDMHNEVQEFHNDEMSLEGDYKKNRNEDENKNLTEATVPIKKKKKKTSIKIEDDTNLKQEKNMITKKIVKVDNDAEKISNRRSTNLGTGGINEEFEHIEDNEQNGTSIMKKKKKKKKVKELIDDDLINLEINDMTQKLNNRDSDEQKELEHLENRDQSGTSNKIKKKNKVNKLISDNLVNLEIIPKDLTDITTQKKKSKKKNKDVDESNITTINDHILEESPKRKKKRKQKDIEEIDGADDLDLNIVVKKKKIKEKSV